MITCPVCGKARVTTAECPQCDADLTPLQRLHEWPQALMYHAMRALGTGQLEQAENDLRQIVSICPDHVQAHALLGQIHEKNCAWELAGQSYQKAADLDPECATYKEACMRVKAESAHAGARSVRSKWLLLAASLAALAFLVLASVFGYGRLAQASEERKLRQIHQNLNALISEDTLAVRCGLKAALNPGSLSLFGIARSSEEKQRLLEIVGSFAGQNGYALDDKILIMKQNSPTVEYVVKPGTSLSEIASWFYGDPGQWRRIHERNLKTLTDPALLLPGQKLLIPLD